MTGNDQDTACGHQMFYIQHIVRPDATDGTLLPEARYTLCFGIILQLFENTKWNANSKL